MNKNIHINQKTLGTAFLKSPYFYLLVLLCVALLVYATFSTQAGIEENRKSANRDSVIELLISNRLDIDAQSYALLPAEYSDLSVDKKIHICRVENSNKSLLISENVDQTLNQSSQLHIVFFIYRATSISDARAYAYVTDKLDESNYNEVNWNSLYTGSRVVKEMGNGWFDVIVNL